MSRRSSYTTKYSIQANGTKLCKSCQHYLPPGAFTVDKTRASGLNANCRDCLSVIRRRQYADGNGVSSKVGYLYGITPEEYASMYYRQNGQCAICLTAHPALDLDHSHTTGAVRGLLCRSCNHGLGRFNDDPAVLRRAAAYVEERGKV